MFAAIVGHGPTPAPLPPQLHAPDGFLSIPVAAAMWLVTIVVLAVAVRRTNATLDERAVPLLGVTAAFIFAAQMFNFQVVGGTSGHLLGGVLAAVLLGPWAATLVMACVIARPGARLPGRRPGRDGREHLQHGRGRHARRLLPLPRAGPAAGRRGPGRIPAAGIAAWASVVAGAAVHGVELAISGTTPLAVALPAMVGVHVFIGVGEALITMARARVHRGHPGRPVQAARRRRAAARRRRRRWAPHADDRADVTGETTAAAERAPRGASAAGGGSPAWRSRRWSSSSSRRSPRPTRTASSASPGTRGSSARPATRSTRSSRTTPPRHRRQPVDGRRRADRRSPSSSA